VADSRKHLQCSSAVACRDIDKGQQDAIDHFAGGAIGQCVEEVALALARLTARSITSPPNTARMSFSRSE